MIRIPFNDAWRVGPLVSVHEAIVVADAGAAEVTLPHDAMLGEGRSAENSGGPQTAYFRDGKWTYEKRFDVPAEWATKRVTFEFEGVYRDAVVYINGAFAGQWAGGYSRFHISASSFLKYGEVNTIRVDAQAHQDSRWYSGGGIHRPVSLLVGDLVHVTPTGLRVTTPDIDAELATVVASAEIVNEDVSTRVVEVHLEIQDATGEVVASDRAQVTLLAGDRITTHQRAYVRRPSLWSVDTPHLYQASVRLRDDNGRLDEAAAHFGVRTVTVDPFRGLRLNGETVKLRGGAIHHDNGILGAAEFADAAERRVRMLKAAGFNAVRSAHNPMSVALLDACDRLGMLVMDELFDVWTVPKSGDDYSRKFPQWWERDVDSIVAKDFNHPSVIMYSIGNEIIEAGTPHGTRWGRRIADRVRAQDPTRLVTHALQGMYIARDKIPELKAELQLGTTPRGLNDYLGQAMHLLDALMASPVVGERLAEPASVLDVVGLNYGESRYVLDKEAFPNRVVVGSETFPTKIDRLWQLVTENSHVIGDFTWTAWDFLGEVGTGRHVYPEDQQIHRAPYPWLTAECGDIDITGQRQPISYYREIVYGLTHTPYAAVRRPREDGYVIQPKAWTWTDVSPSWTFDVPPGSPLHVEAYAAAEEVEFRLNGTTVATVPVGTERGFVAEADVPYEPGVLEVIAYRDGAEVGRSALHSAGEPARLSLETDRSELHADPQRLAHIDVRLVDANGVINPNRDAEITIEVEGPAVLQGFGSAAPSTEESYLGNSSTSFRGRALAIIRATGEAGRITVTARAHGLPDSSLEIEAVQARNG
ncbi:glycoside hydrolase family 2 TIM barrel-domain containing protein [Streptomyces sp. Li-HN-5-11]|uniref:glycoside hydrolase family 2 TIM barrel-domain containing protein n=1 Tax=Streptomyces sp. Li-HN-5-11 TaxID=3075432 RepID=UPI0028AB80DD|nr:glycoside hydrolase family 2 TIM barrel-domain containing protein [Streptomyces sp. Li-HN-5-11]WNM31966.1 glycoside hydrolase family 2 TIM barrel-domain containing protein [Streptomyces sp. Li-HN-5-11]